MILTVWAVLRLATALLGSRHTSPTAGEPRAERRPVPVHQPSLAEPVHGQADDLEIQANELLRMRVLLEELLVRHTGQPAERIAADIERDKIFTAEDAVAYGLADRIVGSRRQPGPAAGRS